MARLEKGEEDGASLWDKITTLIQVAVRVNFNERGFSIRCSVRIHYKYDTEYMSTYHTGLEDRRPVTRRST